MKLLIAHGLSPSIAEHVRDVLTDHYTGIRWIVEDDSSVGCVLDEPVDQCVLATVGYASLFLCGWFRRDVPTKTLPPLVPMSREERARRGLADARGDATPSPLVQADQSDVPTVESAGPSEGERKRNP